MGAMAPDSLDGDAEARRDLLTAVPLSHEPNELLLARGQGTGEGIALRVLEKGFEQRFRLPLTRGQGTGEGIALRILEKGFEQCFRYRRREEWLVRRQGLDREDDLARGVGFQKKTAHPGPEERAHRLFRVMRREDQDFGRRCCTFNFSRRFETIELRHFEVKDRNVGDELLRQGNGLAPSHRLATDLPARMRLKQASEAAAN